MATSILQNYSLKSMSIPYVRDANEIISPGVYRMQETTSESHVPTGLVGKTCFVILIGYGYGAMQIIRSYYPWEDGYGVYIRSTREDSFGEWKRISWGGVKRISALLVMKGGVLHDKFDHWRRTAAGNDLYSPGSRNHSTAFLNGNWNGSVNSGEWKHLHRRGDSFLLRHEIGRDVVRSKGELVFNRLFGNSKLFRHGYNDISREKCSDLLHLNTRRAVMA